MAPHPTQTTTLNPIPQGGKIETLIQNQKSIQAEHFVLNVDNSTLSDPGF